MLALLAGITLFSVYQYLQGLKEKYALLNTLNEVKNQVTVLENEKQNLLQTLEKEKEASQQLKALNSRLKDNLRAGIREIAHLNAELQKTRLVLEQANAQVAGLKDENATLKSQRDKLAEEKQGLLARLGSLRELKKALIELRKQALEVGAEMKEQSQSEEGNKGFVIKDGKSTYPAQVRIEVAPAPALVPKGKK